MPRAGPPRAVAEPGIALPSWDRITCFVVAGVTAVVSSALLSSTTIEPTAWAPLEGIAVPFPAKPDPIRGTPRHPG
jgi:hypothetical protein